MCRFKPKRRNIAVLAFGVCLSEILTGRLAAQEHNNSGLPSGESPARATLTSEGVQQTATGVDVMVSAAFSASPLAAEYGTFKTIRDIGIDTSEMAISTRTALMESDLRVIGQGAAELQKLKAEGVNLSEDPRAAVIRDQMQEMKERGGESDGGLAFYSKAVVSPQGLYDLAIVAGTELSFKALGDKLEAGKKIESAVLGENPSREVRLAWLNGEKFARGITGASWQKMHLRAALAAKVTEKLSHEIVQQLIDETVRNEGREILREVLDDEYKKTLGSVHESGRRFSPYEIRRMFSGNPRLMSGLLQPKFDIQSLHLNEPIHLVEVQPELRALQMDPVIHVIASEDMVLHAAQPPLRAYHYHVYAPQSTYNGNDYSSGGDGESSSSSSSSSSSLSSSFDPNSLSWDGNGNNLFQP